MEDSENSKLYGLPFGSFILAVTHTASPFCRVPHGETGVIGGACVVLSYVKTKLGRDRQKRQRR